MPIAALPPLRELALRLVLAAAVTLWLSHAFQRSLVESLIPLVQDDLAVLDSHFRFTSIEVSQDGPNEVLQVRANLARPMQVGAGWLYPFGWGSIPAGGYQVSLTLGGILQYGAFFLIMILAWPVKHPVEWALRFLISIPLIGLLLFVDVPFTILAELWNEIHRIAEFESLNTWLAWSRFMMGGGGLVFALAMAVAAVAIAARVRRAMVMDSTHPGSMPRGLRSKKPARSK